MEVCFSVFVATDKIKRVVLFQYREACAEGKQWDELRERTKDENDERHETEFENAIEENLIYQDEAMGGLQGIKQTM